MSILKTLHVKHTVSYLPAPLVCFCDLPGYDAELTPQQTRQLAAAMLRAADECETLFEQTRWYGPVRREYPLEQPATLDVAGFTSDQPIWRDSDARNPERRPAHSADPSQPADIPANPAVAGCNPGSDPKTPDHRSAIGPQAVQSDEGRTSLWPQAGQQAHCCSFPCLVNCTS